MQYRRLGQTAIEVSPLGLGTVKFGRNQGVKYPNTFNLPSDAEIQYLLALAKELGINVLDTAPAYGHSEERLGRLLTDRKEWIISTKVGESFKNNTSYFDFSPKAIKTSVEQSLKRLNTDYLDIVLVHSNGEDERLIQEEAVFDTLSQLKKDGSILAYGMSTKTVQGGLLTVALADVVMLTYHPTYLDEYAVIKAAHEQQKGVFIKKAFASGHAPSKESLPFILKEPGVSSVIVGTLSPSHLRENVACLI